MSARQPITEIYRLPNGEAQFTCARCGKQMSAPPSFRGMVLCCLNCRLPFVVPDVSALTRTAPVASHRLERRSDVLVPEVACESLVEYYGPFPTPIDPDSVDPLDPLLDVPELSDDATAEWEDSAARAATEPTVTFQDFEVIDRIGGGGMGAVYKVGREGKIYALKLLDPVLATDESYLRRFQQEAVLLQRVNHPNLVRVYESGVHEQRPYILMEYCNGPNLRQVVKRHGRLGWPLATAIVARVAQGLNAALANGLIHRDIKPDNILLVRENQRVQVKVVDFGLIKQIGRQKVDSNQFILDESDWLQAVDRFARQIKRMEKGRDAHLSWRQRVEQILSHVRREFAKQKPLKIDRSIRDNFRYFRQIADDGHHSLGLTQTGECFGTPKFMAPEMWLDVPGDHRSDIFALGVTWYWLVSRSYPFEGRNVQDTMERILRDPPNSFSHTLGIVSLGAEAMIYAMINKLPDQRYPTYERLLADCHRLLRGEDPVVDFFGETIGLYTAAPDAGDEAEFITQLMRRFIEKVSIRYSPTVTRPIDDIG